MSDSVKNVLRKALGTVLDGVKNVSRKALSTEPVVAINFLAGVAVGINEIAAGQLKPGDGWVAGGWVVVVYFVRRYVSPAVARV
jgi:hypothetical protein